MLASLEMVAAPAGEVTGVVRLSAPSVAVPLILTRLIPRFVAMHPHAAVAGIRLVEAIARDMIPLRLYGPCRLVVVGAPSYFERHGAPQEPADLAHHWVGLLYGLEPILADDIAAGRLEVVLEQYAPRVPGLFLYFASRTQTSPAFRAFIDVAREMVGAPQPEAAARRGS